MTLKNVPAFLTIVLCFHTFMVSGIITKSILVYFQNIGKRNLTMNLHSLLHLPDVVKDLGPLWAHSCFLLKTPTENFLSFFMEHRVLKNRYIPAPAMQIYYDLLSIVTSD